MVYPEGTRSRTTTMKPFKKGAFLLAVRHQRPVLPVALVGTAEAWTPDDWMLKGGHVELEILDPVPTTGLGDDDVEELRARVEAIVGAAYEGLKAAHGKAQS
jgi:1-acyl-sn-glycerol-3-phosphate acyltransferase